MPNSAVRPTHHPTKEKLIVTVIQMLEERPEEVGIEEILKASGVSTGSMYHHFEDVDHLVETAYARRFSMFVDFSISMISDLLGKATSKEEMIEALFEVTQKTQAAEIAPIRYERARIVAMAQHNERFRSALRVEQQRLTSALEDHFRDLQNQGWMNTDFDARAASVMIQAYTLGKVVDDFAEEPMDPAEWTKIIDLLLLNVFAS